MANNVGTTNSRVITLWVIADTRFDQPQGRKPPSAESGNCFIENSANREHRVRGCGNPDRNRPAVASNRLLPKAQIALAGCPGAKERLGGRAVLALCRGRCAMSRAERLKSAATCLSAGSHPPAAQSVTERGCEKPNRKPLP